MPVSAQQRLLRTLIAALKAVAAKYNVVLDGVQERTATDAAVRRALSCFEKDTLTTTCGPELSPTHPVRHTRFT